LATKSDCLMTSLPALTVAVTPFRDANVLASASYVDSVRDSHNQESSSQIEFNSRESCAKCEQFSVSMMLYIFEFRASWPLASGAT